MNTNTDQWKKYHESSNRIEDLSDKSQIVRDYYSWLFSDPVIELKKDLDVSLGISHRDPFIYHPSCIDDLFHTHCLQKLGRITQLSSIFRQNPGAWHSRLEHSIAAFNKKQEEHIYLWMNNPDFVKYVEDNDLKSFLIAEEIKILYHDVGHFPFSHITEKEIIMLSDIYAVIKEILGPKAIHEFVGETILLQDHEVSSILRKLGLYDAVCTVLKEDILNSHEHDDGNIDTDRKAFVETDIAHLGGIENPIRYPIYSRKIAKINPDGSYMKSANGSIILTDSLGDNSKYIDVFASSDISSVENVLSTRESLYTNHYYHPTTLAHDTIIGLVQSEIALTEPQHCPNLANYIRLLQAGKFLEAKQYDEVDIFKDLINLGLHSKDPNIIDMVSLLFVPFENWLNLMAAQLDRKKDADFIQFISKELIHGTSRFAQNLRTKDFFDKNVIIVQGDSTTDLKEQKLEGLIYNSHSLRAYKPSQPIYVEDCEGNIFPLENHPNRTRDWANSTSQINVAICILPLLKFRGISPETIKLYKQLCRPLSGFDTKDSPSRLEESYKQFPTLISRLKEGFPAGSEFILSQLSQSPSLVRQYISTSQTFEEAIEL